MADTDLITLAEAREFLQKQSAQTAVDDVLEALITRASRLIQRHIELEVAPANTGSKTFDWDGGIRLSVNPYVLRSVLAVTLDPNETTSTALTSGDWRLMPNPARDGVYHTLHFDYTAIPSGTGYFPYRQVSITGTWGFESVPDELKQATCVTVVDWYRGRVAGFSAGFQDAGEQAAPRGPEALPLAAYRILESWRRIPV
jgi:hypothetical protein